MTKCSERDCEHEVINNDVKCILHCKKDKYQDDRHKGGFLESFFDELIEYTLDFLYRPPTASKIPKRGDLKNYLNGRAMGFEKWNALFAKDCDVVYAKIKFPERDSRDLYDFQKMFEKLGGIHFDSCDFSGMGLNLKNPKLFFQDCKFHHHWFLYNHKVLDNVNDVVYQNCEFKENVDAVAGDSSSTTLDCSIFCNCIFKKTLAISAVQLNGLLFHNIYDQELKLKNLSITNCTFTKRFELNNYEIENCEFRNTIFNDKFHFRNNLVDNVLFDNTNFLKLVNYFATKFNKFEIKKCIFDDFVGFENCVFGNASETNNIKYVTKFTYTTFLSFINFRYTKFLSGLDIVHINLKEPPNFLNADIHPYNTPRETFRIIKYSFDRIGNYIEANKYFENEMRKYKEELIKTNNRSGKMLLRIYELTSNYGQSYIRPITLILFASLIYWSITIGYEHNFLYKIYIPLNDTIGRLSAFLNSISRNVIPFNRILKEGMEFISLIFYVIFSSFIWLIVLAIKRRTKR